LLYTNSEPAQAIFGYAPNDFLERFWTSKAAVLDCMDAPMTTNGRLPVLRINLSYATSQHCPLQ